MSKPSADRLRLPSNFSNWPRTLHAKLIERLSEQGAAVIVFDVFFKERRSREEDERLGNAIAKSGRTVLLQFVQRDMISRPGPTRDGMLVSHRMISPIDDVAWGAVGLAPFPLPRVPAKVDQFWAFKRDIELAPTLPLVALQILALQSADLTAGLPEPGASTTAAAITTYVNSKRRHADLKRLMVRLREIFADDSPRGGRHRDGLRRLLRPAAPIEDRSRALNALIAAYEGADRYFLNFYGPAGTITTIPYDRFITAPMPMWDLNGKVVFIGVSELTSADRKEGFYTVFSRDDGIDLSGVEIAATAFANLLYGETLRDLDLPMRMLVLVIFGVLVVLISNLASGIPGAIASIGFGAIYVLGAQAAFSIENLWLPVTVPFLVQVPLAILLGLFIHYGIARRVSENFARGVRYYLPQRLVQHLAHGEEPTVSTEPVEGVCLVTDLEGYTPLSESLPLQKLTHVTTQYYDLVGRQIETRGGEVLRYTGDGMICAWTPTEFETQGDVHRNTCLAAIDIVKKLDHFNHDNPRHKLSIRIGLHAGKFDLGIVGGGHHYEQSALGDVINTASRIEGLNKELHTKILSSGAVTADLGDILYRRLGVFRLFGKSETISISEIIAVEKFATPQQEDLCKRYEKALQLFESRDWKPAIDRLDRFLLDYPNDGPAEFIRDLCLRYQKEPPPRGPVVIVMENK